jgi:hypothetical protein
MQSIGSQPAFRRINRAKTGLKSRGTGLTTTARTSDPTSRHFFLCATALGGLQLPSQLAFSKSGRVVTRGFFGGGEVVGFKPNP